MFRKLWAFYKRDWQLALTYRLNFLFTFTQTAASLVSFFFIGKLLVRGGVHPLLAPYQGDYFRFVLLGLAFSGLTGTALASFNRMISFERAHGTLEAILLAPTSFTAMALGKTLWELTASGARVALYFLLGIIFFRVNLSQANWFAVFPVAGLTLGIFLGAGMISAGLNLLWRETGPVEFLLEGGSRLLAGVYFPVAIFPAWLKGIASWLPLTHALEAIRQALIQGTPIAALGKELIFLSAFALLSFPLGILTFHWALNEARRRGHLGFGN